VIVLVVYCHIRYGDHKHHKRKKHYIIVLGWFFMAQGAVNQWKAASIQEAQILWIPRI
jgi:hypothetical protein